MPNRMLTLADVFNPVETMRNIYAAKAAQQQAQMGQMQLQQARQEANRRAMFQQQFQLPGQQPALMGAPPVTSAPPTATPTPPALPQVTEDDMSLKRGQGKIASMQNTLKQAIAGGSINEQMINTINTMQRRDPDIQATLNRSKMQNVQLGWDRAKAAGEMSYTMDFTKDDLQKIAQTVPGAQSMAGLPAGNYDIVTDLVTGELKSAKQAAPGTGILSEKSLTKQQLTDMALHGTSKQRRQASNILNELQKYDVNVARAKYEAVADTPFSQWSKEEQQAAYESFALTGERPRFARGDKQSYSQFYRGYNAFKVRTKMTPAKAKARQVQLKGLGDSYVKQTHSVASMEAFKDSLNAQIDRIDPILASIKRVNPRLLNVPIRTIKTRAFGSAEEQELAFKLDEIWNDLARISGGNTESVGELSQAAQTRFREIFDPNLNANVLKHLMNVGRDAAGDRYNTMKAVQERTLDKMEKISTWGKKPSEKTKPKFTILGVE